MDIFSNLQVIGECLFDKKRTNAFKQAVKSAPIKNKIVIDAGTGSGILSLFAAKDGAKKVYALEIAPDITEIAKKNFENNSFKNVIEVKLCDITKEKFNLKADVLICEMLDTGLIAEQQCQAINNLLKNKVINKNTTTIPNKIISTIELIDYNFDMYGFNMKFTLQARNYGVNKNIKSILSGSIEYDKVAMNSQISEGVDRTISVPITKAGTINAIRIKSKVYLTNKKSILGTSDMLMPVIVPIDRTIKVYKNQLIQLKIKYKRGAGFNDLRVQILPAK